MTPDSDNPGAKTTRISRFRNIGKILTDLLSKSWWTGLGVIVAAVLAIYFSGGSVGEEEPSTEVLGGIPIEDEEVNIAEGETWMVNGAIIAGSRVTIGDGATLLVPEIYEEFSIVATEAIELGANVVIQAFGMNGDGGANGMNGAPASADCLRGDHGTHGEPGTDGGVGSKVRIATPKLTLKGELMVNNSGGDGGSGGYGGVGGVGGRADRSDGCRGGDGGNGGNGGPGGNAGNGGNVEIEYIESFTVDEEGNERRILEAELTRLIRHVNDNSLPGIGGELGRRGGGGSRRGAWGPFGWGAQPGGSDGSDGTPGAEGGGPDRGQLVVKRYISG